MDAVMTGRMYVPSWRSVRRRNDYRFDQQYQQYGQQWDQQYGRQWGRRRQSRSPFWGSMAERGMNMGQEMAERGMEMGLRLAERRMEMEERLGRDWERAWDQDWDQDRRRDGYRWNNRGNYDSRRDRIYWDPLQGYQPIQTVYFFKGGNPFFNRDTVLLPLGWTLGFSSPQKNQKIELEWSFLTHNGLKSPVLVTCLFVCFLNPR